MDIDLLKRTLKLVEMSNDNYMLYIKKAMASERLVHKL